MLKGRSFFFILLLLVFYGGMPLAAQEEDEDEGDTPIVSDWSEFMPTLYSRGDQVFVMSLGFIIPAVFWSGDGTIDHNLNLGGTGSLSYNYFLNSHFFIGGELGGMFAGTLGKNMFFAVPFGVRAGYQLVWGRMEFPVTLMLGAAPQRYLDRGYFGLVLKPAVSAFWRFNSDWSFGLNAAWWWLPQWTRTSSESVYGNFLEATLSARYHF